MTERNVNEKQRNFYINPSMAEQKSKVNREKHKNTKNK